MPRVDAAWWAVTIDGNDPRRVADFWVALLGGEVIEVGADRPGWLRLQPRGAAGPFLRATSSA